jgi:hypothetical protein
MISKVAAPNRPPDISLSKPPTRGPYIFLIYGSIPLTGSRFTHLRLASQLSTVALDSSSLGAFMISTEIQRDKLRAHKE